MLAQLLAIARNTFFESIRQPIMLVVLMVATIAIILANPLAAFTMEDDQRMLIDMGLATIFLCGCLLAAFIATNVLGREIENKTALTVVSKPVPRPVFVVGKYLGVAAAITLGTLLMTFVFMLTEQHTVLQTARSPLHGPVLIFSFIAFVLGTGTAVWCNYFYGRVFASTVVVALTPLAALAYLFSMMFTAEFSLQPISVGFKPQLWLAVITLWMAILVLTAIALAVSTRLGQVMTLVITLGVFIMGMLSDWTFGRRMEMLRNLWLDLARSEGLTQTVDKVQTVRMVTGEVETITSQVEVATQSLMSFATFPQKVEYALYQIGYAILPNFQVMFLSDALTQGHLIPVSYIIRTLIYGVLYIGAALAAATFLFQTREVG
jgi:ABC-type transport system involved in multi-copper enzyme maturation permease subunit